MDNTPELPVVSQSNYNREYYARNKERIAEQRRARRLTMTEQERETKRAEQRKSSRKHAAKRKAEIAELVTLANRLADTIEARN